MKIRLVLVVILASGVSGAAAPRDEFFPIVPDDIEVSLFASEPLVRNPCAITFDAQGRLCVGMGPQYRHPRPDTPGDSVWILLDNDDDGRAEGRKEFATGFNSIQGLAWREGELWVANSPDLTVVRDLDGDDQADEYVRIYTDLGNLEHGLHGLNWASDGKLYMSKGNSKGLTQPPDRVAPKPFRELWGVDLPGLPEFPKPVTFKKGTYQKNYHDPQDDWGREGGVLRCDPSGGNLEIFARGFRNPWDIAFDDQFNWLGTDNDQVLGDKLFSPFYGAHFGWGHSWSFDWKGEDHLPTVPANGPLFEGSGAGVIFCGIDHYPEKYRGVFFVNDWLRREVFIYRPVWNGAQMIPSKTPFDLLASAGSGRSMDRSHGRKFDPVDIELGPDGAIYISSWGREYGATPPGQQMQNEGRIYRLWPKQSPPRARAAGQRNRRISERPISELIDDLGSHLPVWRVDAQEELIRRGAREEMLKLVQAKSTDRALRTWAVWTLGRMDIADVGADKAFSDLAISSEASLDVRIQCLRVLAHRGRVPQTLRVLLESSEPRIRFEMILAMRQAPRTNWTHDLVDVAARETDRLVYYATWRALRALMSDQELKSLLTDPRNGVRRAAVLALLENDALDDQTLRRMARDADAVTAGLASQRLKGKFNAPIRGRPIQISTPSIRQRQILQQPSRAATFEDVRSSLKTAAIERGKQLFFAAEGANCAACHRLSGIGNAFAPDLKDIGGRADADFIIRSIIDPSANITEGFVQQTFTTDMGEDFSGIVLEESGVAVKLALSNGETLTVPREMIRSRRTSKQSAMPSNFGELLSARQIADITAFLLAGEGAQARSDASASSALSVQLSDGQFEVRHGTTPIGSYVYEHPEMSRPALVNLRTTSGTPVTREFPAPAEADHRWMHPGIAISFGWLDGNDYWRFKARVRQVRFVEEPAVRQGSLSWTARNHYLAEGSDEIVCVEEARYTIASADDGWSIHIESEFFNNERDFYFGDQEESGLCIRMAGPLCVKGGTGTITNNRGERNEAGTWGREFDWIDYSGVAGDRRVGILIVPDSNNPRPSWSHSRDYGVLVANPFPRQPKERKEPFVKTKVQKGERYRLRYSLLIYEKRI